MTCCHGTRYPDHCPACEALGRQYLKLFAEGVWAGRWDREGYTPRDRRAVTRAENDMAPLRLILAICALILGVSCSSSVHDGTPTAPTPVSVSAVAPAPSAVPPVVPLPTPPAVAPVPSPPIGCVRPSVTFVTAQNLATVDNRASGCPVTVWAGILDTLSNAVMGGSAVTVPAGQIGTVSFWWLPICGRRYQFDAWMGSTVGHVDAVDWAADAVMVAPLCPPPPPPPPCVTTAWGPWTRSATTPNRTMPATTCTVYTWTRTRTVCGTVERQTVISCVAPSE